MRAALVLLLILPVAAADDGAACEPHRAEAFDAEAAAGCGAASFSAGDPNGRTHGAWDERGMAVFREPRFVSWGDGPFGCELVVAAAGAVTQPCPARPPAPPALP